MLLPRLLCSSVASLPSIAVAIGVVGALRYSRRNHHRRSRRARQVLMYANNSAHCILYVHCTLYTIHITVLYTVHCTLRTVNCKLHTAEEAGVISVSREEIVMHKGPELALAADTRGPTYLKACSAEIAEGDQDERPEPKGKWSSRCSTMRSCVLLHFTRQRT